MHKHYIFGLILSTSILVQADSPELACVKRMNTLAHTTVHGANDEKASGLSLLFQENLPEQERLTFKKIHADYATKQAGKKVRPLSEMLDVSEQWCHQEK